MDPDCKLEGMKVCQKLCHDVSIWLCILWTSFYYLEQNGGIQLARSCHCSQVVAAHSFGCTAHNDWRYWRRRDGKTKNRWVQIAWQWLALSLKVRM
jgi:hypothetical protein